MEYAFHRLCRAGPRAGALVLWIAAAGCARFDVSDEAAALHADVPNHFSPMAGDVQSFLPLPDPLLDLLREARASNLTIQEARARLDQARAAAEVSGAARLPLVTLDGEARRARTAGPSGDDSTSTTFTLGIAAAYELDLWGRVRAASAAAGFEARAVESDVETAEMTILASVAEQWATRASLSRQRALAVQQLDRRRKILDMVEFRFRRGQATALDVYQQREAAATLASTLPGLEARERASDLALSALLGRMPGPRAERGDPFPDPGALPPAGVPAEILANRPDVEAARRRWMAADAQTAAARADRWPAIRLTGRYGHASGDVDTLFDNWIGNLAAGIAAPIVDGGRRRAEVRRTDALRRERALAYRRAVVQAVREVEDAMVRDAGRAEEFRRLQERLRLAEITLREAETRYRNGALDFLNVVSAQLSRDLAEQQVERVRGEWWIDRISLLRALGRTTPLRPDAPAPESAEVPPPAPTGGTP